MDPVFIKGMASFLAMVVVFVGSAWLLLAMILGTRLGYFVMATCLFGVMILVSAIWFATGLGPKGPDGFWGELGEETGWHSLAAGPELTSVQSQYGNFDLTDFPAGKWEKPSDKGVLADVTGTSSELNNARPSLETLISDAVSDIPGKRNEAKEHLTGDIALKADEFEITEVRMKEANVKGKTSILALGKAVPSGEISTGTLGGATEGEVTKFLAKPGDMLSPGAPVMEIKAMKSATQTEGAGGTSEGGSGDTGGPEPGAAQAGGGQAASQPPPAAPAPPPGSRIVLTADKAGKLVKMGFKVGDKIKPNVPMATIDLTGQPGAPAPAEVAAVRVRGSVRVPSFIYLAASTVLFLIHLVGLGRVEKRQKAVTQAGLTL